MIYFFSFVLGFVLSLVILQRYTDECPECVSDISLLSFGSIPEIGSPLFFLAQDAQGNQTFQMVPNGRYTYRGYSLIVEDDVVVEYKPIEEDGE